MSWTLALAVYAVLLSARYAYVAYRFGMRGSMILKFDATIRDLSFDVETLRQDNEVLQRQVQFWQEEAHMNHEACARKIKRF